MRFGISSKYRMLLVVLFVLLVLGISCATIYIRNFRLHKSSRPLRIEKWKIDPIFHALLSFDKNGNEVLSPDTFDVYISFERDLTSRDTIIYDVTIDTLFLTFLPSYETHKLAVYEDNSCITDYGSDKYYHNETGKTLIIPTDIDSMFLEADVNCTKKKIIEITEDDMWISDAGSNKKRLVEITREKKVFDNVIYDSYVIPIKVKMFRDEGPRKVLFTD